MSADDRRETATIQIRFLRHLLDRLDTLASEASPWEGIRRLRVVIAQRLTVITDTEPADRGADGGQEQLTLIAVELHRLRRTATAATITTRGGHRHRVRVLAVGHRHTVVHTHGGLGLATVLMPLRFIESVDSLESAARH
ncbi:hypothetical protein [Nocardia pseudovaccinii]|uniref:hypothetical protein n=1 Tax=Nocardia pseudovaccinii TaxID=189540 RepID=UPI0007A4686B|nr:hypothetical protein [Nocardia pseudovaccinii]